ncbi:D-alanyl-D-alanine carboxypeptidase/D-alanyl-D-alanine-endopeptidase [Sphingomonas ginsenosidimutans]|jgi:D-alanyl-D-alanine carboxypeptidase/D-alanyl-D-alanine-endopeptidase (penicillin-binding protein 4)|uniref:D-alanyl-D-alanine carboxypeptidase/D-alanyl-D-alanine endopeptidase n=2 Tax=Sphingomonas TaxID=13687 RepID=UPI0008777D96|nr:D-alanyl-D-alanine carboxypeptidase/D-alanyl-D-alanine-endopeptidase [Sphingomonas ginsenosidimutans]MBY0300725.1 D-alanyl-D-alanine carboxypeptidase/D-alanyl-D-alanine-endopeptidase [Sphingomonas ginsenosidimutans]
MRYPLAILLLLAAPAASAEPVEQALATAPAGTRIGLLVVDEDGREVVAIRADERFVPASNTKLFTTAAAFANLDTAAPDAAGGASVRLDGGDVILSGHGDARLSAAADCTADCLSELARAVAARTRTVRDVIGDDTFLPDERWPAGMSWNNMAGRYGTAISALTIDDNVVTLTVTPGAAGAPAAVAGDGYFRIDNRILTAPAGTPADLGFAREPGSDLLRLTGTIPAGGAAQTVTVGLDDPAHRAAWLLARQLRDAGVRVTGRIAVRHRAITPADDPAKRGGAPVARAPEPAPLARLTPPPLAEDIRHTNKVSQNLHADLLLRRVGAVSGSGSVADGQARVDAMLAAAGVPRDGYDFADGSGMSNYNRITPRTAVRLLRWAQAQPWGAAWRATLPVGGQDGTLARRFAGTALAGKLFAKTGTLNAANALSGYLVTASGRTYAFSALANDMPQDASATRAVDRALLAVAAAH